MADDPADRFLAEVERLALRMVPEPLRAVQRRSTPGTRELRYADATGLRIVLRVDKGAASVGIVLEGAVGERVFGNLVGSREILEQTLGAGLIFEGEKENRWIGESIPLAGTGPRNAERIARRLATFMLIFKPMMDDLGSRT